MYIQYDPMYTKCLSFLLLLFFLLKQGSTGWAGTLLRRLEGLKFIEISLPLCLALKLCVTMPRFFLIFKKKIWGLDRWLRG